MPANAASTIATASFIMIVTPGDCAFKLGARSGTATLENVRVRACAPSANENGAWRRRFLFVLRQRLMRGQS
jgi:hypothetical protein